MKSIKLAMILLVGQCVFNPLAAQSKPEPNHHVTNQDVVDLSNKIRGLCSGQLSIRPGLSLDIVSTCAEKGVYVDGTTLNYGTKLLLKETADNANALRKKCTKLSEGMGSTNPVTIFACASVGVGVDATNLD